MNVTHSLLPLASRTPALVLSHAATTIAQAVPAPSRYRERDFGIGYGLSSGYALDKRYTSDWGQTRFRCG